MTSIVKMDQKSAWPYTLNLFGRPWVVIHNPYIYESYSLDAFAEISRNLRHARYYGGDLDERGYCFTTFEQARTAVAQWNEPYRCG